MQTAFILLSDNDNTSVNHLHGCERQRVHHQHNRVLYLFCIQLENICKSKPDSAGVLEVQYNVLMLLIIELRLVCKELILQNYNPMLKLMLAMLEKAERMNKAVVCVKSAQTSVR